MKRRVQLGMIISGAVLFTNNLPAQTATDSLRTLLHSSCKVYEYMRNANGIYRKTIKFDGTSDSNPSSVAVIGMGLTSLCISNAMGWEPNAKNLVLATLQSMTGNTPGFSPDKNSVGFFAHYIDMNTGANIGSNGVPGTISEYSTIDNAVLISGVLFCKKYFNDPQVTALANQLWNGQDWSKVVADPATGKVYLQLAADGSCGVNVSGICGTAIPYNEYMVVCWLAMNQKTDTSGPAHQLWNNFYGSFTNLPFSTYNGISVKTARPGSFIAEHVYEMPYLYCHGFSSDQRYLDNQTNARRTDSAWWHDQTVSRQNFEYGISAGSVYVDGAGDGYSVDQVNNNAKFIVSPHTLSGYMVTHPEGKYDLLQMWNNNLGVYAVPSDTVNYHVLWRYSKEPSHTAWKAAYAQGVDFAVFMLGLAALPEFLGNGFFNGNNDFFHVSPVNVPPVAHAGTGQTITLPVDSVTLDGSASTDPDGTIVSYSWAKIAGP
jgi:hypothetical protein